MAVEVFNRYEIKYLVSKQIAQQLIEIFNQKMQRDTYKGVDVFEIANIYYDTINNELISQSIEKPKYKEKIRLRGYGDVTPETIVYLEIKKKYYGLVNKRRTAIAMKDAVEFIKTKELPAIQPYMNVQVLHELHHLIKHYTLLPMVYLAYRRIAFKGIDEDLRITFDDKILTRRDNLSTFVSDGCDSLLDDDKMIIEVKTATTIPLWLCNLFAELDIRPTSFSKYGTEYKNTILNEKRELSYVS